MRTISPSEAFDRKLVKFLKQHRELSKDIKILFVKLELNLHDPVLKTHKLHGKLSRFHGASINYRYRIVFRFDEKHIYPQSIGSHDDVY